ncbi:hypothetical protein B0H11DRAFT_2043307 [Mycena galericulata]|nr:hypothetical protein B0H11DRAFT_2043307 [Mycena galericulata]
MHFHLARSLWVIALVCVAGVRSKDTNYTLDDTSPAIIYTPNQSPILRCSPDVCDPATTSMLHNGTATITGGSIIIPFTGSAVYVYLGMLGNCMFNLDGIVVGEFENSNISLADNIYLAFMNWSMPDVPHVLTIYPQVSGWFIELDYIIYTHNPSKLNRGTIIGGVVGGIAAAAILSVGAFFLRRRRKQKQLSTRGIPLGDHWPDKPNIKLARMGEPK